MTAQQIKDNTDLLIRQKTAQHSILKTEVAQQLDDIVDLADANIPLTGTTTGNPVTGDIELSGERFLVAYSVNGYGALVLNDDGSVGMQNYNGLYSQGINLSTDSLGIHISSDNPISRGITTSTDYSSNITDLDYTQKIYVDTKASKIGADNIEITDFTKGVILTAPDASRWRITVDNAGILTTTLVI